MSIFQFYAKSRIGQVIDDLALHLDNVIFSHKTNIFYELLTL